jgi:hypothetical protein
VAGNAIYYVAHDDGRTVVCRIDMDYPDSPLVTPFNIPAEQRVMRMAIGEDGSIHVLANLYSDENANMYIDTIWYRMDENGVVQDMFSIGRTFHGNEWPFISGFEISASGKAYISIGHDIYIINVDDNTASQIVVGSPSVTLFKDGGGMVYASWGRDGVWLMAVIDEESRTLGMHHDITPIRHIIGGGSRDTSDIFLLADESGVYRYDTAQMTMSEYFNWFDINVITTHANAVYVLADGRILWVDRQELSMTMAVDFNIIRPQTVEEINLAADAHNNMMDESMKMAAAGLPTGEGDIVLGVYGSNFSNDRELQQSLLDFNRANPGSRIEIKEYGSGDAALFQLNTDIITGNCPDILLLPQEISYGLYAQKGLFLDLLPFLENDDSFAWADYQENIIRAFMLDGKLSAIPISFSVMGMRGTKADLGDQWEWDLDGLIAFADRFPTSNLFHIPTKSEVLDICLMANAEHMVDWSNADASFDRHLFIKTLEFANRFHDEDRYIVNSSFTDWEERIGDGDVRLIHGGLSHFSTQRALVMFGEPISQIGYPSERDSGFLINSYNALAINKDIEHGGTAWRFIRYLLSDAHQSDVRSWAVKKSGIDGYIELLRGDAALGTFGGVGPTIEARPMNDEEVADMRWVLDNVSKIRISERQVEEIIKEEVGAYFSGQKTAAEVADIVANRVGVYVNENR